MMMKRAVSLVVCGLGLSVLAGCPIWSDDRGGSRVCIGNDCYSCPQGSYSADCTGYTCGGGSDCPAGYTCGTDQQCHYGNGACASPNDCPSGSSCGADNRCHAGDCSLSGCPSSYVCKLGGGSAGVPACVPLGGGVSDSGAGDGGGIKSTCQSDTDCSDGGVSGAKCLTGACVSAADQCADTTQCPNGAQCVGGACTPSCSGGKTCPTGYACDTGKGVCTQNPSPCTDSSTCNGKVCVEQHCVDACGAGGTCGAGLTCLDGGCTPTQTPVFVCSTDGAQDACQPGSICLRHSCYIACGGDAGADTCKSADQLNQCKSVTTSSGAHQVCGSTTNLGSDCDPTQGKNCSGSLICIDGFCK